MNHLFTVPKVIIYSDKNRIDSYYKKHNGLPAVKRIEEPSDSYMGLLLPKHSPLSPSFKLFGTKVMQNGLQSRLMKKWFGDSIPKLTQDDAIALTFGHFVLCFTAFLMLIFTSIVMLCFEKLYFNNKSNKTFIAKRRNTKGFQGLPISRRHRSKSL